jgi:hypothetical protein
MWRTPSGERVLQNCEWRLFCEGLSLLRDQVEESMDDPELCFTGVRVFDRLEPTAKLAMLALVGSALHDEREPCPELTALSEGTFAAVYALIRQWIDMEIDFAKQDPSWTPDPYSMRELVLAAFHETHSRIEDPDAEQGPDAVPDDDAAAPSLLQASCDKSGAWADVIDRLMDQVLWADRDFEEEDLMLDVNPDLGSDLKSQLGIDDDYFTAVAPEPSADELVRVRQTLRKICERAGNPEK